MRLRDRPLRTARPLCAVNFQNPRVTAGGPGSARPHLRLTPWDARSLCVQLALHLRGAFSGGPRGQALVTMACRSHPLGGDASGRPRFLFGGSGATSANERVVLRPHFRQDGFRARGTTPQSRCTSQRLWRRQWCRNGSGGKACDPSVPRTWSGAQRGGRPVARPSPSPRDCIAGARAHPAGSTLWPCLRLGAPDTTLSHPLKASDRERSAS